MEALYIYLIKSSGLIALFYLAYYFMLRKETFFTSNRWFLLLGLFTSAVLPLVVYTKIIMVESSSKNIDWSRIPITNSIENEPFEINWYIVFGITYAIGIILFMGKFVFDFYSLNTVLKGKTIQNQADFKFIDTTENVAPFSYFNTIVYNSSLYSSSELENILEHEKVHSDQNHTVDVLISRLFCILFWFNPLIWLYKKAILQNLEFIADNEATKKISDKKAYQFTLLKITTHENCVAITNHFYQSLIKKRIVMLNKNQSKKSNSWKYVLIIPALVAFVILFQVNVIAQEKTAVQATTEIIKANEKSVDVYKINKNTTDEELKEKSSNLKENYAIIATFSGIKRNSKNELTAIKVDLKKGKEIAQKMETKGTEAINEFGIIVSKDDNGMLTVNFGSDETIINQESIVIAPNAPSVSEKEIFINGKKVSQDDLDKINPKEIAAMNVNKNDDKQEIRIITNNHRKMINENDIYINNEKVSQNELDRLDQSKIERMDVNKDDKTIRIITKNGIQYSQEKNLPVPPTPPTPPVFNIKTPAPPAFPKAPKAPKGDPIKGDKKAWKEFEKKMEDFEAKMKKLEPQMEAFDKQMGEFDKKMEPFNKEMEAFEKKMKVYEQQMEEYHSNLERERKK
ncbi:M56 family metallopeptidase [Flavobacterium algoritolerans]|uniref:M56 family metallopeptidase n=1 Tax=Flavobacterium algoritolerans TaxID=3041254 RepID=A0ABT6VA49_9FLAO|nr:M56 family metallopeptidase [Flavobacterium algoritolerans]MDI5894776.1 M56 family metallopeptidase [Flavobacterium algoritolerans]